jgi:hypothetical protein
VIGRRAKKGHRKPIRRLAMTSILKQNTVCFALPLCRNYRQRRQTVSITKGGDVQLEKYSGARRETLMVVAVLEAPSAAD